MVSVVAVLVLALLLMLVGVGGGVFLGEVRTRPIDTISSSLGHRSKSTAQTSNRHAHQARGFVSKIYACQRDQMG